MSFENNSQNCEMVRGRINSSDRISIHNSSKLGKFIKIKSTNGVYEVNVYEGGKIQYRRSDGRWYRKRMTTINHYSIENFRANLKNNTKGNFSNEDIRLAYEYLWERSKITCESVEDRAVLSNETPSVEENNVQAVNSESLDNDEVRKSKENLINLLDKYKTGGLNSRGNFYNGFKNISSIDRVTFIKSIQILLQDKGFYKSRVDGLYGNGFKRAVILFKESIGKAGNSSLSITSIESLIGDYVTNDDVKDENISNTFKGSVDLNKNIENLFLGKRSLSGNRLFTRRLKSIINSFKKEGVTLDSFNKGFALIQLKNMLNTLPYNWKLRKKSLNKDTIKITILLQTLFGSEVDGVYGKNFKNTLTEKGYKKLDLIGLEKIVSIFESDKEKDEKYNKYIDFFKENKEAPSMQIGKFVELVDNNSVFSINRLLKSKEVTLGQKKIIKGLLRFKKEVNSFGIRRLKDINTSIALSMLSKNKDVRVRSGNKFTPESIKVVFLIQTILSGSKYYKDGLIDGDFGPEMFNTLQGIIGNTQLEYKFTDNEYDEIIKKVLETGEVKVLSEIILLKRIYIKARSETSKSDDNLNLELGNFLNILKIENKRDLANLMSDIYSVKGSINSIRLFYKIIKVIINIVGGAQKQAGTKVLKELLKNKDIKKSLLKVLKDGFNFLINKLKEIKAKKELLEKDSNSEILTPFEESLLNIESDILELKSKLEGGNLYENETAEIIEEVMNIFENGLGIEKESDLIDTNGGNIVTQVAGSAINAVGSLGIEVYNFTENKLKEIKGTEIETRLKAGSNFNIEVSESSKFKIGDVITTNISGMKSFFREDGTSTYLHAGAYKIVSIKANSANEDEANYMLEVEYINREYRKVKGYILEMELSQFDTGELLEPLGFNNILDPDIESRIESSKDFRELNRLHDYIKEYYIGDNKEDLLDKYFIRMKKITGEGDYDETFISWAIREGDKKIVNNIINSKLIDSKKRRLLILLSNYDLNNKNSNSGYYLKKALNYCKNENKYVSLYLELQELLGFDERFLDINSVMNKVKSSTSKGKLMLSYSEYLKSKQLSLREQANNIPWTLDNRNKKQKLRVKALDENSKRVEPLIRAYKIGNNSSKVKSLLDIIGVIKSDNIKKLSKEYIFDSFKFDESLPIDLLILKILGIALRYSNNEEEINEIKKKVNKIRNSYGLNKLAIGFKSSPIT